MTVLGGSVTVLGACVVVSGASVPVVELEVSGALEVLGDTESEGVDEDVSLQPVNARTRPAAMKVALSAKSHSLHNERVTRGSRLPMAPRVSKLAPQ